MTKANSKVDADYRRMYRLSERQVLFLRLIAANGPWCPKTKWEEEKIKDDSGDVVPHIGGGSDARILRALIDKGLITKPRDQLGWCFLRATPEGQTVVERMHRV